MKKHVELDVTIVNQHMNEVIEDAKQKLNQLLVLNEEKSIYITAIVLEWLELEGKKHLKETLCQRCLDDYSIFLKSLEGKEIYNEVMTKFLSLGH